MPKLVLGYQQKAMFRLKPGTGTGTSLSIASLNGAYCKWLWQINQIMITKSLQMELMKQYRMENSCSNTWYSVEVLDQATWTTWLTCYKKFIAEIWQRKSGNSKLMVSDFENIINNYYAYLMYYMKFLWHFKFVKVSQKKCHKNLLPRKLSDVIQKIKLCSVATFVKRY